MWSHLRAILMLPFMVTIVIPGALIYWGGLDTMGLWKSAPWTQNLLLLAGASLATMGLSLMWSTIRLFATVGEGTLAPWDPTQKLVVEGIYRYVRNPMISGVFFLLLAETCISASLPLLGWSVLFIGINVVYIPLFEEVGLRRRFGESYDEYRRNVPAWIPRLTAWEPMRPDA